MILVNCFGRSTLYVRDLDHDKMRTIYYVVDAFGPRAYSRRAHAFSVNGASLELGTLCSSLSLLFMQQSSNTEK